MDWTESVEGFLTDSDFAGSTRAQYRLALAGFRSWYVGSYGEEPDPALLTDEEAREWRAHLLGVQKLAAATVNTRLAALRGLARSCDQELRVRGVRRVEQPGQALTGRELGRLVAAVEAHQWGPQWLPLRNVAIVSLLARAGLRVGEVVALDGSDVEINDRSGWVLVRQGKGLKERRVPLSAQARKVVAAYLEVHPARADGPLFVTKTGKRMDTRLIQRMVQAAAQRAGIAKRVTPHTLRRTFATRFLQKGGDLASLRTILGHANIATTSRYLQPDAGQMQEMVVDL